MKAHSFAQSALLDAWDRARSDSISAMDKLVLERKDILQAIIGPDREAAGLLCRGELFAWRHEKAVLRADLLFWGACFAISSLLLLGAVIGSIYVDSLLLKLVLALLCLSMTVPSFKTAAYAAESVKSYYKLRVRGYARGARGILTNSGYSLWGFGQTELYVVHNTRKEGSGPSVGVYKYDDLGTPLVEYEPDQIAVELKLRDGSLIRVMILPGDAGWQAQQITASLEKNTSGHDQKSLSCFSLEVL